MGKTPRLRKADEASARAKALSNALTKGQAKDAKADAREIPSDIGFVAALLSPSIMTQIVQAHGPINQIKIHWPTPGQVLFHMAMTAAVATLAAVAFRSHSHEAVWSLERYVKWPELNEAAPMTKERLTSWSSGPFDCFQDIDTCCWTCWCPGVRWAGTVDMVGLLTFWPAFLLFLLFELLAMIPFGGCCCLGWIAVLTYYRLQLRFAPVLLLSISQSHLKSLVSTVGVGLPCTHRPQRCPKTHGHASLRDGSPTLYLDAIDGSFHTQSASHRLLIPL
eukprot:Skav216264  [mRNA]  locus=scaffold1544:3229:11959:- [translate_table: standard]